MHEIIIIHMVSTKLNFLGLEIYCHILHIDPNGINHWGTSSMTCNCGLILQLEDQCCVAKCPSTWSLYYSKHLIQRFSQKILDCSGPMSLLNKQCPVPVVGLYFLFILVTDKIVTTRGFGATLSDFFHWFSSCFPLAQTIVHSI